MNYNTLSQNDLLSGLHHLMTVKKVYRDSELSITNLAKILGAPKRRVSELIRDTFEKSFPIFLNDFRLEEVLIKFNNQEYKKHTIFAIALEAGFPSKSTFYRFFQKRMKISPSEYLRNHCK